MLGASREALGPQEEHLPQPLAAPSLGAPPGPSWLTGPTAASYRADPSS